MQQLGPWGPAAFILAVVCAEMIPLFPTQPLALSSGLLFGAQEVGKQALPNSFPETKSAPSSHLTYFTIRRTSNSAPQTGGCMLQGAFCTILSTTLAASIAYTVAQGLGKNFAKKLIDREVGEALERRECCSEGEVQL